MFDVAVIGAGVVGTLIARELTKCALRIVMLESGEDVASGASKANSGIMHGGFDPKPGTLKAKLNILGTAMAPHLAQELSVPFRKNGSLVLAFDGEDMETVGKLYERGIENNVPGMEIIDAEELQRVEPFVSENAVGALYTRSSGIICPYELTVAAAGNAMDNGAELLTCFEVCAIEDRDDFFRIISSDAISVDAKYIINCAGVHADDVAALVGDTSFGITPRKGEYLLFDKAEGEKLSHTLFRCPTKMGKGVLVTPTADGNLLVGPTAIDSDDKSDTATTRSGMETVLEKAAESVKQLNARSIISSFCGIRAVAGTGDFIIETSKAVKNFINVAGIESPGLSSAPAIAVYVSEMLADMGLTMRKNDDFYGKRRSYRFFKDASVEEKNAITAKDPTFGHVVCRCETVTEGEIIDAIHRNPQARSLDALKRRLRTGMGRCQGGFCTTYVTEILSRELGIPADKVTKCGAGSELISGKTKGGAR